MSGTVGFSSPPERGSTFWLQLHLPIAQAPREANAKDAPQLAAHLEVLIVDDNAVNRMVATRLLEVLGCRATAVEGGQKALEVLETQSFDCILMDCQMPEMDGFEATRRIRALEVHKRVPIIAVTAGALQEDRIRCTEAGMDGFLPKPMSKAALASALSELTAPLPDAKPPIRSVNMR
jgi:CheY-like chemotaxis protein